MRQLENLVTILQYDRKLKTENRFKLPLCG
jgi:hypothetical protein